MNKIDLSDLRRNYQGEGLNEEDLPENPVGLLSEWVDLAVEKGVKDANAMALGTTSRDGRPDTRIVLLKEISGSGITFFTNYDSEKARQLEENPVASCCLWWSEFERQVRLQGSVAKVDESVSDQYFSTRPRESQISAWASKQSHVVSGRQALEEQYRHFEKKFNGQPVPRPANWGGYRLMLESIEFWQGRPGRLHDRILYEKEGKKWVKNRLAP